MGVDFVSNYDFFENVGFRQCPSYIATNICLVNAEFSGKYSVFAVCYGIDELLNTLPYCLCPYYGYAHFAVFSRKKLRKDFVVSYEITNFAACYFGYGVQRYE